MAKHLCYCLYFALFLLHISAPSHKWLSTGLYRWSTERKIILTPLSVPLSGFTLLKSKCISFLAADLLQQRACWPLVGYIMLIKRTEGKIIWRQEAGEIREESKENGRKSVLLRVERWSRGKKTELWGEMRSSVFSRVVDGELLRQSQHILRLIIPSLPCFALPADWSSPTASPGAGSIQATSAVSTDPASVAGAHHLSAHAVPCQPQPTGHCTLAQHIRARTQANSTAERPPTQLRAKRQAAIHHRLNLSTPHSKIKEGRIEQVLLLVSANVGESYEKNKNLSLTKRNQLSLHQLIIDVSFAFIGIHLKSAWLKLRLLCFIVVVIVSM